MTWQDLLGNEQTESIGQRHENGTSWAERLGILNQALEARVQDQHSLSEAAESVVAFARSHKVGVLFPASDVAARLVDAAQRIGSFSSDAKGRTVLVVDGLLASGAHMMRAADVARAAGATRVIGWAAVADRDALSTVTADLGDEVIALEVA